MFKRSAKADSRATVPPRPRYALNRLWQALPPAIRQQAARSLARILAQRLASLRAGKEVAHESD